MNRTFLLASAIALLGLVPGSADAYWPYMGYGGYGGGYGWGFNQATNYVPSPPYYAIYPPVYYSSQITARHYGASPFAWSPGMQPITYGALPVVQAMVIKNPHVTTNKDSNKVAEAAHEVEASETGDPTAPDRKSFRCKCDSLASAIEKELLEKWLVASNVRALVAECFCAGEADPLKCAFLVVNVVILCAGCQSADPLAAFGPYRVPAPSTAKATPYYPPTSPASQQADSKSSPARMSVSAEGPLAPVTAPRFASDPKDREPIRVVENPGANTRTAAAPNRGPVSNPDAQIAAPSTATAK